ncbi:hypothetical protein ACLOJK_016825 [Asimina triloba]
MRESQVHPHRRFSHVWDGKGVNCKASVALLEGGVRCGGHAAQRKRKMSRKGKRKDEDEYGSDREEASHPKKVPRSDPEDSDSITICDISKNRRVSVRSWQGKVVVDIREFYMKDGRVLPGKKGLFFFDYFHLIHFLAHLVI